LRSRTADTTKNSPALMWKSSGRNDGTSHRATIGFRYAGELNSRRAGGAIGHQAQMRARLIHPGVSIAAFIRPNAYFGR